MAKGFETVGAIIRRAMREGSDKPIDYRAIPYDEYLTTAHWQRVRRLMLDIAKRRCQRCGSTYRLEVHHLTYERLGNEKPNDLRVLCRNCHVWAHSESEAA